MFGWFDLSTQHAPEPAQHHRYQQGLDPHSDPLHHPAPQRKRTRPTCCMLTAKSMHLPKTVTTMLLTINLAISCSSSESAELHHNLVADNQVLEISGTSQIERADDLVAIGTGGLDTYDESIPDGDYNPYYIYHENLETLSTSSDVVFVGRVINYIQAILSVPQLETSPIGLQTNVYDGIVFSVDELLAGNLPANTTDITVLTFALVQDAQGSPILRISDSPIELVRPGIEQRNLLNGPEYLVFAVQEEDRSSPFYRPNFYYFNTPGSIVEVLDGGFLGVGVDKPLSSPRITEDRNSQPVNSLLMTDVRDAVAVVSENKGSLPRTDPGSSGPLAGTDDARND